MKSGLILIALAVLLLGGCAKTVTWKEEVELSDGRVIVVERETLNVPGGDEIAHGSGYRPTESRIRIDLGRGFSSEWRSTKVDSNRWPENPLVLDIANGDVTVMSAVPTTPACVLYSKYVFRQGVWKEESLSEEFTSREANLYLGRSQKMPDFVDLTTKNKANRDVRYPQHFRRIGPHRTFCQL